MSFISSREFAQVLQQLFPQLDLTRVKKVQLTCEGNKPVMLEVVMFIDRETAAHPNMRQFRLVDLPEETHECIPG